MTITDDDSGCCGPGLPAMVQGYSVYGSVGGEIEGFVIRDGLGCAWMAWMGLDGLGWLGWGLLG